MLIVNKKPIIEPVDNIIGVLRSQLQAQGIMRFQSIKRSGSYIITHCPIHKGGQERRPSCGIKVEEDNKKTPVGYTHCFTCGYSASLSQMISDVFGMKDYGRFGAKWLINNFVCLEIKSRPEIQLDLKRGTDEKNHHLKFISNEELSSYRYYHPYMFARRLTEEVIERYDVGYDKKTKCLTFPVRDLQGRTLFIARRSVEGKYFNYPKDIEKPLYGIYEIKRFLENGGRKTNSYGGIIPKLNKIYICESIINALTVNVYNEWAVATNGSQFSDLQLKQIIDLPTREVVIAFDNDESSSENYGQIAAYKLKLRLSNKKLTSILKLPADRDINDLSFNSFKGLKRTR